MNQGTRDIDVMNLPAKSFSDDANAWLMSLNVADSSSLFGKETHQNSTPADDEDDMVSACMFIYVCLDS